MTETDIKAEIGELFRDNERLRAENDRLRNGERAVRALMDVGIKSIVDSATYFSSLSVRRTGDGELQTETYDSWVSSLSIEVPNSISRNELMAHIEPLLKATYDEKRAKAIETFEAGESDE